MHTYETNKVDKKRIESRKSNQILHVHMNKVEIGQELGHASHQAIIISDKRQRAYSFGRMKSEFGQPGRLCRSAYTSNRCQ